MDSEEVKACPVCGEPLSDTHYYMGEERGCMTEGLGQPTMEAKREGGKIVVDAWNPDDGMLWLHLTDRQAKKLAYSLIRLLGMEAELGMRP
jgi:hypothetical protein